MKRRFAIPMLTAAAVALSLSFAAAPGARAADRYAIDETHADVVFSVMHLGFSKTYGRFGDVSGSLTIDEENPANSSVEVEIATASLDTNHAARDAHLMSDDFFDVVEHPTITFVSDSVEVTGENTAKVSGTLTMLGVAKPVTLDARLNRIAEHPLREGVIVAGFSGTTTIKRSEWGMDTFVPAISDEVEIVLEIEAIRE